MLLAVIRAGGWTRQFCRALPMLVAMMLVPLRAVAQDPPPRIGPYAIDGRATVPLFPGDPFWAASRGLLPTEMPGAGLGWEGGAHLYLFTWKAVTVGIGGQVTLARSHAQPAEETGLRGVLERFTSWTPQLSLNFGDGDGWSYLSGGLGSAVWSLVPDGASETFADQTRLRTVNYGGGARWFIKPRLAFTLDVRFHQIDPGPSLPGLPGSPRTTFMIIGAGASVK
jgi:hypothetical protein